MIYSVTGTLNMADLALKIPHRDPPSNLPHRQGRRHDAAGGVCPEGRA
jgi:hypothetical protein